jgi:hypothetical protein
MNHFTIAMSEKKYIAHILLQLELQLLPSDTGKRSTFNQ